MNETEFQTQVRERLCEQEVDNVTLQVTESENAVIAHAGETDAAYTADEARVLAEHVKDAGEQDGWIDRASNIASYLNVLADIVDNERDAADVADEYGLEYTEDR